MNTMIIIYNIKIVYLINDDIRYRTIVWDTVIDVLNFNQRYKIIIRNMILNRDSVYKKAYITNYTIINY